MTDDDRQFPDQLRARHSCDRDDGEHGWGCVTWFPGLGQTEEQVRAMARRLDEAELALGAQDG